MNATSRSLALALALTAAASGGVSVSENPETAEADGVRKPQGFMPAFDALLASYELQNGLDFDSSGAELDSSRFGLAAFLSRPVALGGDWNFLPMFASSMTSLDFSNSPAGFPLGDEELYEVGLHATFYNNPADSRWIYGAWTRANFASDTESIDSDDFYFDVALGGGYMVTERFLFGLGVVGLELGSDARLLGGPGFYWKPAAEMDVSLIGALFNATWRPVEDWVLALRVRPYGDSWNIDNGGASQQLDFSSYTVRLHAERRIFRDVWLSAGVGYSFANELELRDSSNNRFFEDDLDGGLSTSIALRVRTW